MRKMRKEKTMKKIVSAVMALLMTIALFVPTYADVQPEMRSQRPDWLCARPWVMSHLT